MKPPAFDYVAPRCVEHALELLHEYGDDAKLLAGGQTLGPMLNLRFVAPEVIIDLNRIALLGGVGRRGERTVIGALTRQAALEDDGAFCAAHPLVAEAIPHIAHRPIRNRGTVGGSLAHADPAAEWAALALALDAELTLESAQRGSRRVVAQDFFDGPLTTVIEPDELLTGIEIAASAAGERVAFVEFGRRAGDFALAGIACRLGFDEAGRCVLARLALIGAELEPRRFRAAEAMLEGEPLAVFAGALAEDTAAALAGDVDGAQDLHASSAYRQRLCAVLTARALRHAVRDDCSEAS